MKKIILKISQVQVQMRILHWQTNSYAEHMAFGGFYAAADPLFDRLVEAIQGKYGKITLGGIDSVQVSDMNNLKLNVFLLDVEKFFCEDISTCGIDLNKDSEIKNILDEICAEIQKLKYLLTLK